MLMNSARNRPAGASSASRYDGNDATNPTMVLRGINDPVDENESCEWVNASDQAIASGRRQ
jgi:hypothetical protein